MHYNPRTNAATSSTCTLGPCIASLYTCPYLGYSLHALTDLLSMVRTRRAGHPRKEFLLPNSLGLVKSATVPKKENKRYCARQVCYQFKSPSQGKACVMSRRSNCRWPERMDEFPGPRYYLCLRPQQKVRSSLFESLPLHSRRLFYSQTGP